MVETLTTQLLIAPPRIGLTTRFGCRILRATPGHRAVSAQVPARGQICVEELSPLSTFRLTPLRGSSTSNMFAP
jgi:hypothetical protein